jgi:hypothetical protein
MLALRATIRIDVMLTDERVLEVIKGHLGNKPGRLSIDQIAIEVKCHPNTARNAIKRLRRANRLVYQVGGGHGKASTFEVLEHGE